MGVAAQAQDPPPTPPPAAADTLRPAPAPGEAVPLPPVDSVPADTVKAAFAVGERPRAPELRGQQYVWDRERIFVTGALTLAELVSELPGATALRSGYLLAPTATNWYGDPGRVRVFLDGVEMDPLDRRLGGSIDLATIPLWSLEEVAAERTAGELRLHLRSWRVERTTAQTRADIVTGAENLNLYRGFYGKRMRNGFGLQIAGQQFSTTNSLVRGDGDALGGFARLGWARGAFSLDAAGHRVGRRRDATRRDVRGAAPIDNAIPAYEGSDVMGYVRAALGNPDGEGVWLQAIAATVQAIEDDSAARSATSPDADSVVTMTQWIAAAGLGRGGLRLSATARVRAQGGETRVAPSLRASWDSRWLSLAAFAELEGPDSTRRLDALGRVQLLPWVHVGGGYSLHSPEAATALNPERSTLRGELGVELAGRWISAGIVQRSELGAVGFPVFDPAFGPELVPASTGLFLGLGGPIWGPFSLDWRIHEWDDEYLYRPKVESRAELRVETALRRWLKRDTFRMRLSFIHDYRSNLRAPDGAGGIRVAEGASAFTTLLDIRIGTAHVFFHNRNFTGMPYETVPGYLMPRLAQQYGIRWEFWN